MPPEVRINADYAFGRHIPDIHFSLTAYIMASVSGGNLLYKVWHL